ncbi:hypothetical protein AG4045_002992, partial [Apium graveolens]
MAKVDYINLMPVELLTCIFICMHAKSLGICKCVSKSWNSLISDPYFIKSHLNKTSITKLILLPAEPEDGRNPESERSLYSVHFDNNHSNGVASRLKFNLFTYRDNKNKNMWSRVWGSCDGLILVEDYRKCMFLLNPTTLEFNMLPLLPCRYRSNKSTCNLFGLGYDSSCDDYAVVAIVYKYEEKDAFVYIYTLKTKQWKGVESVMSGFLDNEHAAGILVGGSIYWLAANHNHSSLLIVEFNIASKEFSRLAVPNGIFDSRCRFRRLGIHEGCLCLINMNVFNTIAELWVMQGDGAIRSCIKLLIAVDGHSCFVPSIDNLVGMGFYKPFLL